MPDDPTVVALVRRARDGEHAAWGELVERYSPLVWAICSRFRLGRDDAEDVSQTVWLKLVERLDALREPAALPGWLSTTTRHECLRVLRGMVRHGMRQSSLDPDAAVLSELVGDQVEVEHSLLEAERHAALRVAFSQLSARCQELLSLLVQDPPVPYTEISARLGMTVSSIGPNRGRCLAALRRCPPLAALIEPDAGRDPGGK